MLVSRRMQRGVGKLLLYPRKGKRKATVREQSKEG
jgi:hypothetical protein